MSAPLSPTASWQANQSLGALQYLQHLRPDLSVYARQTLPDGTTQVLIAGPAAAEAAKGESNALVLMAGGVAAGTVLGVLFAVLANRSDEPKQLKPRARRR